MYYDLIATSTFGLESVVAKELKELGYDDLKVENGRVTFKGDERDIVTCNLWVRTADRILIKMAEFKAETFEDLFEGTLSVNWGDMIPINGIMHVEGKSIKSKLFSVPDCQSIVKKAIIESMKRKYRCDFFNENGVYFKIEISLLKDIAMLTVDTSGPGLHKRGYRAQAGQAPLKETLAASLVLLSKWKSDIQLADPLCGSGTIPIEAAMIGRNIAPGLYRSFDSESWSFIPEKIWEDARKYAENSINKLDFKIMASDIDGRVLKTARENAQKAGVYDNIVFNKIPVSEFSSSKKGGYIICNPPYGQRIGEADEVKKIYEDMGKTFEKLNNWSYFVITSHDEFEKLFGRKSDKNRKLYNGRIKCYYYEYF